MFGRSQDKESAVEPQERSNRRFRALLLWRIVLFVSLTAAFLWYSETRLLQMELRLRTAEGKAASVNQRVLQFANELDLLRERTGTAEREASHARREAQESSAAQRQSELDAEQARSEAERARGELEQIRAARQADLDKMQEALNRVAPTRRTPSGMVIQLGSDAFEFDFDRADLRPQNRELLSRIAGILLASNGYGLYVYGHTDDIGTNKYNQDLSERRAASVRDYLVKSGISEEIIQTKGFGKSSPLLSEKTPAAREKNRRVEIGIVDTSIRYLGEVQRSHAGSAPLGAGELGPQ